MSAVKAFFTAQAKSTFKNYSKGMPPTDFCKAAEGELFPQTDPTVDGPECLLDCDSCTVHYPRKFEIETEDKLYGFIDGWSTHAVVATGKTDWVRDVADEKGSVMEAIGKAAPTPSNGKLKLSASNIPVPDSTHDDATSVLLLPAWAIIDDVRPANVATLITSIVNHSPTNTTDLTLPPHPAQQPSAGLTLASSNGTTSHSVGAETSLDFTIRACPHKYIIMLCSQKTRDARCGQSAPLLRKELERHLRPRGLFRDMFDERPGGVGIYFISHVGGHKYSANVLIYRRADAAVMPDGEKQQQQNGTSGLQGTGTGPYAQQLANMPGAAQCIWLARVRPEDCENIIKYTVLQGKVVKPKTQLRGGFDRTTRLTSW